MVEGVSWSWGAPGLVAVLSLHHVKDKATCTPFLCSASFQELSSCSAEPSLSTQPSAPHLCPSLQPLPWEDPSPPPVLYLPSEKPFFLSSALDPSLLLPHDSPLTWPRRSLPAKPLCFPQQF